MDRHDALFASAGALGVVATAVGLWLPWVSKRPAGFVDGNPVYTLEGVPGLSTGLQGNDAAMLAGVAIAVGLAVLLGRGYLGELLLGVPGLLVAAIAFGSIVGRSGRYDIELGLWVLLAGGLLMAAVGLGSVGGRLHRAIGEERRHRNGGRSMSPEE